tara:strand:- start:7329 stop:7571 length:243 start_codon:yes stop_codon:yes gene_type:complete
MLSFIDAFRAVAKRVGLEKYHEEMGGALIARVPTRNYVWLLSEIYHINPDSISELLDEEVEKIRKGEYKKLRDRIKRKHK